MTRYSCSHHAYRKARALLDTVYDVFMPENLHFPIEKVRALKAYYKACAAGMKGQSERSDYENAALLCDQLASLMSEGGKHGAARGKKSESKADAS